MLSKSWHLEQDGIQLPVVFVTMREAIEYAEENLKGEYLVVKEHHLEGITKRPRLVGQK
jgi:hypothetical protein